MLIRFIPKFASFSWAVRHTTCLDYELLVLFIDTILATFSTLSRESNYRQQDPGIGEVDPFKLTRSSNTKNKVLARILQYFHAMLFAKWMVTPKNLSVLA